MSAPHIFIIDDDKDAVEMVSARLAHSGFKIACVNSAAEALLYLKNNTPDLIILDLLMPVMNGYEFLENLRSDIKNKDIPVIMLSGVDSQKEKIKGLKSGLDDYMIKPYDPLELIARIKAVLRRTNRTVERKIHKVFVTGGAGFIGSALSRKLLQKGYSVVVLDDFSTGLKENISDLQGNENFRLITGSINDETLVAKAVEECDLVYHLAATVGVKNVVDKPLETIINDTVGTSIVLKYACAKGIKVLLSSTSEVYGKSKKIPFKESDDVVIGEPDINRWSYACSKLLDEFFTIGYHKDRGLPVVVIRLFNVVGPGQLGRYGMVIPRFFKMALSGKPITIFGDGRQVRSFTYVDDAIDMIIKLAESKKAEGQVINLGSKNQVSIKKLAIDIKRITVSRSKIVFEPYRNYYGKNFQDIRKRVPDLTKLERISGSYPKTTLEEILKKTHKYYRDNPQELDKI